MGVLQVSVATFDREAQLGEVQAWVKEAGERQKSAGVGALISPLEDEVYVVAITHCFNASGSDPMKYCQQLYNHAKKRIFSSPDPNIADMEYEKYYQAELQRKLAQ